MATRRLKFVIMGEDFEFDMHLEATACIARAHALISTHNTGRPPGDFDLYSLEGVRISPATPVADLPEGPIFVSPQIGAGGSHRNYRRKLVPPIMNGRLWIGSTMHGRNNTRWNWGAHAKAQMTRRRLEARHQRRQARIDLHQETR